MSNEPKPTGGVLETLLARAEHYATFSMRNYGNVPPTLLLVGVEGPIMFIPENLADVKAKDDFANMARLMCIAHAATAAVMTLEAWVKTSTAGEPFEDELPSEAVDRREVVILMGEERGVKKQKLLPILRTGRGDFFGFGESDIPSLEKMVGRFTQILPPKVPSDDDRALAKTLLKVKGVIMAKRGKAKNPARRRF